MRTPITSGAFWTTSTIRCSRTPPTTSAQDEADYWLDPATVETIGEARAAFAVGAKNRLEAIADGLNTFADGDTVIPGIVARATLGHTPGHMSFM